MTTVGVGTCVDIRDQSDRTGWGYVTEFSYYASNHFCNSGPDPGTGLPCAPTLDGSCDGPRGPDDDIYGPASPPPTPNSLNASPKGRMLWKGHLRTNETFRGSLAWSTCPYLQPGSSCVTQDDCSPQQYCDFIGLCQDRAELPLGVDFNVGVWTPSGDFVWLSYSKHDVTESFEFAVPEDGIYEFWRYADKEDWGCIDDNGSKLREYDIFVGGKIF